MGLESPFFPRHRGNGTAGSITTLSQPQKNGLNFKASLMEDLLGVHKPYEGIWELLFGHVAENGKTFFILF